MGRVARVDFGTGEAVIFQVANPIRCLCHYGIRIPKRYGPSRTRNLTSRFSRLGIQGRVAESIITEVALPHFGHNQAAILDIPVPWNFIKFAFILARLHLLTGTSAGKAF